MVFNTTTDNRILSRFYIWWIENDRILHMNCNTSTDDKIPWLLHMNSHSSTDDFLKILHMNCNASTDIRIPWRFCIWIVMLVLILGFLEDFPYELSHKYWWWIPWRFNTWIVTLVLMLRFLEDYIWIVTLIQMIGFLEDFTHELPR